MKRCSYRSCGGSIFSEPNEQTLKDRRETIQKYASCGREAGAETPTLLATATCIEPGCLKVRAPGSVLCAAHRAVATRRERRVAG